MSSMPELLKNSASMVIGSIVVLGLFLLTGAILMGLSELGAIILPILSLLSGVGIIVLLVISLPLSFFKSTRTFASFTTLAVSYVFGVTTWFWAVLITYEFWGLIGLFIGLVFYGVGVLPTAMLASIFAGKFVMLLNLIISVTLIYGTRFWALKLAELVDRDTLGILNQPQDANINLEQTQTIVR